MNTLEGRLKEAFDTDVIAPDVEEVLTRARVGAARRRRQRAAGAGAASLAVAAGVATALQLIPPPEGPPEISGAPATTSSADEQSRAAAGLELRVSPANRFETPASGVEGLAIVDPHGPARLVGRAGELLYGLTEDDTFWVDQGTGREARFRFPTHVSAVELSPDGRSGIAMGFPGDGTGFQRTNDGGTTWHQLTFPYWPPTECTTGLPTAAAFLGDAVYVVTDYAQGGFCTPMNTLVRGEREGTGWTPVRPSPEVHDFGVIPITIGADEGLAVILRPTSTKVEVLTTTDGQVWRPTTLDAPCEAATEATAVGLLQVCVEEEGMSVYLSRDLGPFEQVGEPVPGLTDSMVGGGIRSDVDASRGDPLPVVGAGGRIDVLLLARDRSWLLTPDGNEEVTVPTSLRHAVWEAYGDIFNGTRLAWSDDSTYVATADDVLVSTDGGRTWSGVP